MKTSVIFAFSFIFICSEAVLADDLVGSRPMQRTGSSSAKANAAVARPATNVRNISAVAARTKIGARPNVRIQRDYPAVEQQMHDGSLAMYARRSPANYQPRLGSGRPPAGVSATITPQNTANLQRANANRQSYADALKRCRHDRHDRNWWHRHCPTIVFVNTGYYYLDAGYWYPAYGYDPAYNYYDNDGPIYTYADLLPDQVITNVQLALREAGYYVGPITGSLGPATRAALENFQRDYGLVITAAIDEPTVQTLGLN